MKPVIVSARRTAIVPRGGAFAGLEIEDLAAPVIRACLADAGLAPGEVGELILSNALGAGGNPARLAALGAGLPERVAGLSLDRQCAGGLDAVFLAEALVRAGVHEVVIAGGAESYSLQPERRRRFADGRPPEPYTQARFTPWAARDPDMAEAAARLAAALGLSREAQDRWAIQSHQNALVAGRLPEVVELQGLTTDPFARRLTPQLCARARAVNGSVSVANMAVAADGAAFVVVASGAVAQRLGERAQGINGLRLLSGQTLGGQPDMPGLAPVAAAQAALSHAGCSPGDLARAEIMEAFAAQVIACQRGIGLAQAQVNLDGGALARGHPIGASGAVLAARLFHGLRPGETGLAAIASAGGIGAAGVFQKQ